MQPERIRKESETKIPATDTPGTVYKTHTIGEAWLLSERGSQEKGIGSKDVYYDRSIPEIRLRIQLDQDRYWFLSIFFKDNTSSLDNYSLDYEDASDSHYEFRDEASIRKLFRQEGDEELYLEDIFLRFMKDHSGWDLIDAIRPYITAQYHYD